MNHLLFVDDNPVVLQALKRQLHSLTQEWQMSFVESGQSALDFMAVNPVDIIVADMMMPGMDGAELLAEVKKRHPTVIRIVLSGHTDREVNLRLVGPAHQYLSKPCNAEELRGAILRAFAMRDMLANEQLKQLVTRTKSLPALPSLYLQLIEELRQKDPSVESISRIISQDLGMTSKILQLVNSAFFGLPQPMADIQEAVLYLGLATIRALVLSIQVFSQFDQRAIKGFSIESLADHCWVTGTLARNIARLEHCDEKTVDQCFTAGLLHDVGQLLLATGMPDEYGRVLETVRAREQPIWETELAQFGATHAEVGGYLLGLWGLPNPIVEAVTLHHRPGDAAARGFSPVIAVHVANAFAHDLTRAHPECPDHPLDTDCLARFGLTEHLARWKSQVLDGHVANLEPAEKE
jgi:HD-like signal output (HDOD) protein